MRGSLSPWRRCAARLLGAFAAPLLFAVAPHACAAELPPARLPAVVVPAVAPALTLAAARQAAVDHQPAVAVARASLAAAAARSQALDNLRVPTLIARDLPIRRQQAALGVSIAEAGVAHAEQDARHAATITYLSALYAREQLKTADDAKTRLIDLRDTAQSIIDNGGRKDVGKPQVDLVKSYLQLVEGRRQEAVQGYERAVAALREAMGVGPECPVVLADTRLPDLTATAERDLIVRLALDRRGEIVQSATAVQVFCLEIDAQAATCLPTAKTFASGSDIHAQVLPAGEHDPEYKPGAVAPEMPVALNGSKADRVEQARAYHARAAAVADKARNLIALEADDAFLRWKQFADETPRLVEAAAGLKNFSDDLRQKFDTNKAVYPTIDDLLNAGLRATQADVDAKQARFRLLAALANLERVTAGGFAPGFDK
jgi:outer membrane protein TolC